MNKTSYICTLPTEEQEKIRKQLAIILNNKEDIKTAMSGRVCDIEELIRGCC